MPLNFSSTSNLSMSETAWQVRSRPVLAGTILSTIILLFGLGLLLVSRRLLGAFSSDLPRETILLSALVTTAAGTASRIAWQKNFLTKYTTVSPLDLVVGWGSSLALVLWAIGCCYPGNYNSDWLIWLPLLIADQFWRQNFFHSHQSTLQTNEFDFDEVELKQDLGFTESIEESGQTDMIQQLFRVREEGGQEAVYGTLRAEFQPGQRTAVIHVGFCPPLAYLPEIEAESLPGLPTRIKVVQALAHGVRLDVRLTAPAEDACQVWIDMAARPIGNDVQGMSA